MLPLFYGIGSHISVSDRKFADTYLYIPIAYGAIPICAIFPLSTLVESISYLNHLKMYLLYWYLIYLNLL